MICFLHYIDTTNIIDGNVINIVEYCLFCEKHNIKYSCIFLLNRFVCNSNSTVIFKHLINKLLESKYILKYFKYRIIFIDDTTFNTYMFSFKGNRLVLTDRTYKEIEMTNNINILRLLYKDVKLIKTWYSFINRQEYTHVDILNENESCGDVTYIRKSFFSNIKNYNNTEDAFVLANGERKLSNEGLIGLINYCKIYKKVYYCCNYSIHLPMNYVHIDTIKDRELFNFNTFIYIGSNNYDFAPRMLLESVYLNKDIEFFKYPLNKSTRFIDAVNKDLEKYILTIDDNIFK